MNAAARLEGRDLSCVRDGRTLFEALHLCLDAGQIVQIEGGNGAGKTSLLRILCGLSEPRRGTVHWRGAEIRKDRARYYQELLYIGHNPGIKPELTPVENLRFLCALGGCSGSAEELNTALDQVGLYGYEEVPVRTLSAGQRRRVALARLWLNPTPVLWVLDEPFTAIDRDGIRQLEARLERHVHAGGLVLITSHQALHLEGCLLQRLALQ